MVRAARCEGFLIIASEEVDIFADFGPIGTNHDGFKRLTWRDHLGEVISRSRDLSIPIVITPRLS